MANMFMGHCVSSLLSWEGALFEPWKLLISIAHLHLPLALRIALLIPWDI